MAAFEQHGFCAALEQEAALFEHFVFVARQGAAAEGGEFAEVGGEQVGERHEFGEQGLGGVFEGEAVAGGGDEDGVEHGEGCGVAAQGGGDGADGFGVGQHADFDGVDADVGEDGFALGADDVAGDGVHGLHALGVLRGYGGDDARAVCAERAEGFEVGLDARAAAGVGTGDGEDAGVGFFVGLHGWLLCCGSV